MPPHDPADDHAHEQPADHPHDEGGPPDHEEGDRSLFVVAYSNDAERKRAEYVFNTWDEGAVENPDGLVRVVEGGDAKGLYEDLLVKFRTEQIEAFELSPLERPATPESRTIERTVTAEPATVRSFLQYLVSKKKGAETGEDEYEVYTNKGRADIAWSIREKGAETAVTIRVQGHPPVLDHLEPFIETELDEFAASQ